MISYFGLVQPATSLPFTALHGNATVIEINPNGTPLAWQGKFYRN